MFFVCGEFSLSNLRGGKNICKEFFLQKLKINDENQKKKKIEKFSKKNAHFLFVFMFIFIL